MKSSVITFPGSNCDRDMDVALKKFGFKNKMVWHDDVELPKSDLVVLPGGFSYGDYLRCGSMASKSKIMKSVLNFAQGGGKVMGICNGFQILVESGLLPGVLLRNKYLEFICKNVFVKANNKDNSYFKDDKKDVYEFHIAHNEGNYFCSKDQIKEINDNDQIALFYSDENGNINEQSNPNGSLQNIAGVFNKQKNVYEFHIAHNEGNYFCSNEQIKEINDNNQIALFYSDENGNINEQSNPNGSLQNIAGVFNKQKNVIGMMPHPERMIDPALSGEDGSIFFKNLIDNLK